jgi:TonB-dependent starch-binding outer membrane protein SusC
MKKFIDLHGNGKIPEIKKLFKIMRLTCFLILVSVMSVLAGKTYSQTKLLNLNMDNATVKEVLVEIEKQSEFRFMYSGKFIDINREVSVNVKNQKIESVLNLLFAKTDVGYKIKDRFIVLTTPELIDYGVEAVFQQLTVSGKVTDSNGQPLPGVSIVVKGTTQGTVTNAYGEYTLTNISPDATLVFSFVGMLTQEVTISNQTTINVTMEEEIIGIEEVVAIGYGTQRKEEVTSSISKVNKEDFNQGAIVSSPMQLVQGKVAGLAIQRPYSDPNRGISIQLRGISTVAGNNNPLIIIDGIPGGNLNTIAPEEIESIDVLRDGSAAAIYGTRGTNGVIIVTTKKGRKGKPEVTYSGYLTSEIAKFPKMLSAKEYNDLAQEYKNSDNSTKIAKGKSMKDYGGNTDWFKEMTRQPFSQVHHISITGGNQSTTYSASLNYRDIEGILKRSGKSALRSHLNLNYTTPNNRFNLALNLSGNTEKSHPSDYGVYQHALLRNPTLPVYNEDGTFYETWGWNDYNPVALIEQRDRDNQSTEILGNTRISFEILPGLKAMAMGAIQKNQSLNGYYDYKDSAPSILGGYNGSASRTTNQGLEEILETTMNYSKLLNQVHRFEILAGYSYEKFIYEGFSAGNNYFITDQYTYNNLGAGDYLLEGKANMSSYKNESKLIAFLGRAIYSYKDKYLLTTSLRQEGSSKFGADNKWGLFPSISIGWRVTEESFMQNQSWINNLKIRAGYGVTGNQGTDPYASLVRLGPASRMLYQGKWIQGVQAVSNPNPNLRWETKHEYNIGVDLTFLKNKLTTHIDLYNRLTKDLIYIYSVPTPPNIYNSTIYNVGEISNKGIELSINANPIQNKTFHWILDFNVSYNSNKLISLSNEQFPLDYKDILMINTLGLSNVYTFRLEEGEPIGNMYGYIFADFTDEGKWLYYNKNGEIIKGSEAREEDKGVMGNGLPKIYSGLTNTFKYKNFDLSVMLRGVFCFDIYGLLHTAHLNAFNLPINVLSRSKDIELFDIPAYNSYYAEKGDFVKLDNVTFGYNFNFKDKFIENVRVYVSGQELYTLTGYSGVDPEVEINGLGPGFDWRTGYPRTKTFVAGFNLTF